MHLSASKDSPVEEDLINVEAVCSPATAQKAVDIKPERANAADCQVGDGDGVDGGDGGDGGDGDDDDFEEDDGDQGGEFECEDDIDLLTANVDAVESEATNGHAITAADDQSGGGSGGAAAGAPAPAPAPAPASPSSAESDAQTAPAAIASTPTRSSPRQRSKTGKQDNAKGSPSPARRKHANVMDSDDEWWSFVCVCVMYFC